jgi:hypothetical protein
MVLAIDLLLWCICDLFANLGGDVGLTIGINKKWNWRIKKKYYEWKNSTEFFFVILTKKGKIFSPTYSMNQMF